MSLLIEGMKMPEYRDVFGDERGCVYLLVLTVNKDGTAFMQFNDEDDSFHQVKEISAPHGTFTNVLLTDYELADLKNRYPQHYEAKIDRLSRYIENKPDRNYPNHYAVLLDWLAEDVGEQEPTRTDNGSSYDINELNKINTLDFIE